MGVVSWGVMAGKIQPLLSQAWSCSSLEAGLKRVNSHYGHLCTDDLTEKEMRDELAVPGLNTYMFLATPLVNRFDN